MQTVNVIVETPKGSTQKYDFDPKTGYFKLKKTMPLGSVFPFDFGFIEGTIGEDGDPLDIIIISEIETFPGCAVDCRIIGAIEAEQQEPDGEKMRNDRYIGIPEISNQYAEIKEMKDFPKQIIDELSNFFVNYNEQAGKKFEPLKRINAKRAIKMVKGAKEKETIKTKLIQLFLPVESNDGKPFPKQYFDRVKESLIKKFNGVSMFVNSPVNGMWEDQDKDIQKDKLVVYEVMADMIELSYWEKYKKDLEKQFKQDVIVVRCLDVSLI
jgi:inorganic pyrophosphatase